MLHSTTMTMTENADQARKKMVHYTLCYGRDDSRQNTHQYIWCYTSHGPSVVIFSLNVPLFWENCPQVLGGIIIIIWWLELSLKIYIYINIFFCGMMKRLPKHSLFSLSYSRNKWFKFHLLSLLTMIFRLPVSVSYYSLWCPSPYLVLYTKSHDVLPELRERS